MAQIERLVETNQLRTRTLINAVQRNQPLYMLYDRVSDHLRLLVVPPATLTVVHYIDGQVALLYEPDSMEVVGFQVEDFEYSFLPKNPNFRKVWILSESGQELENLEDLSMIFEQRKQDAVRELRTITEQKLGRPFNALARVPA